MSMQPPPARPSCMAAWGVIFLGLSLAGLPACGLFDPREAEAPTQSSSSFLPPTDPEAVIENLQSAIEEKNVLNYSQCFSGPNRLQPFVFIPSAGAAAKYPSVFSSWDYEAERAYFQNLVASAATRRPGAFSRLMLTLKQSPPPLGDSVTYSYDYVLTFEHNERNFPVNARGNLLFTLGRDNTNTWAIYRWADFSNAANDTTWSYLKGKFGN